MTSATAGAATARLRLWRRGVPLVLQTEAAECGLACLAMIAGAHGHDVDLPALRRRFAVSSRGVTLRDLIEFAGALQLAARPLRLDLDELPALRTPCILHWDLDHFVVLVRLRRGALTIHDPARGARRLTLAQASRHFTGVALELAPTAAFEPRVEKRALSIVALLRGARGLGRSLAHVLTLALALEACALLAPFLVQWVVDGAIVSADRDLLTLLSLGFALLLLVQCTIALARAWVVLWLTTHVALQWNANAFVHLLRLPVAWFEKRHIGDVVSRFGSLAAIQRTLTTGFVEAIVDGLLAAATLAMMLFHSVALTAVVVASLLAYALLRAAAYGPLRRAAHEQLVCSARAGSLFIESVRAIAPLKLFNREDARAARWINATVDATNRELAAERITLGLRSAQALLAGLEYIAIVHLGALAVIDEAFSVGMLLAFLSYRTTFSGRVTALIDRAVQLRMLRLHGERLADIVLEAPEPAEGPAGDRALADVTLELRDVSFRYGVAEPWILRHVNLRIAPGESVAITGPSGCGKSTLLKILLGLLSPTEGEVRIGGVRVAEIGLRRYRALIGAVLQDDQLFAGTIADNIACFDERPDRRWIEVCAQIAAVHDDIVAAPMGYATRVGDTGLALSGGQRQRVLLARALYRRPRLLLLDEATSHLDVAAEAQVNAALAKLSLTRVIVAHRPQSIANADRVIVLERGAIRQDLRVASADASRGRMPTR